MKKTPEADNGANRRDFLKGTAVSLGAAIAAGSTLVRSAHANAPEEQNAQGQAQPGAIRPDQISQALDADVVVVGAGIAGMCAALSAIEAGAKTVLLEKGEKFNARGFDNGCFNSSVHKEAGITINRHELISELMKQANFRIDQRLVTLWVDKSGEVMDWLRATVAPKGLKAVLGEPLKIEPWGFYTHYPTAVNFVDEKGGGMNPKLMAALEAVVKEKGGDIRYRTPGMQLVRASNARVSGVIARDALGNYIQLNARKGVILTTGGYDNNPEMMKKYLRPSDLRIRRFNSANKVCTGDGHSMGLAVGADIDEAPHCMQVGNGAVKNNDEFYLVMFTPWLRVDKNGLRYVNEDGDYCRQANANACQPGHFNWSILDADWKEGPTDNEMYRKYVMSQIEKYIKLDVVVSASTLEELAGKMQVSPDTLKATIDRYNELAKKGHDLDFGVAAEKMKPVVKAPFYAIPVWNFALVTVSGLRINTKLQVVDPDGKPIPGLYAAGNTSGGFFADTYPRNVGGISHGRAITFGRLAGLSAAAEKV
jgi:fumarate reductase flavoprotein subunit